MLRRAVALALPLLTLLTAVGCGSDDSGDAASSTTSTASPSTSSSVSSTTTLPTSTSAPSTTTAPATTSTAPPVTRGATVTAAPPAPTTTPAPPYESRISTVTATDLYASWRAGCPVPVDQLRAVDLSYWGFDGQVHTGRLVVLGSEAAHVAAIFADLYADRYPIERMVPIDVYGGDDDRSMAANNTSAFNCRQATGGSSWSEHAYGRAIDLNPFVNPYVKGSTVLPPAAARYADRSRHDPGMIHAGDRTVRSFASRGWRWGGYWTSLKDYQHFSTTGR